MRQVRGASRRSDPGRERGQVLVLFVFGLVALLGFVALTIDVGLAFHERRSLQNATDAAALAGAQDLYYGESEATAEATALDYMQRNEYTGAGASIQVNIPPVSGAYQGEDNYVEVVASTEAPTAFLALFQEEPYTVNARAVAVGKPGSDPDGVEVDCNDLEICTDQDCNELEGDEKRECKKAERMCKRAVKECEKAEKEGGVGGSGLPPPAAVPEVACGSPTVDGRVTDSDGYIKIGDLRAGDTDFGDVFVACDADFYFFGMRLNALSADNVSNENVYGPKAEEDSPGYNETYQTGWEKDHTYGKLKGSDRARFQIACDGAVQNDFIQDYLIETGDQWKSDTSGDGEVIHSGPTDSASSLEWNLEHPVETGWGDDPGEDPLEQSPPFNPLYPTYDSEYDGWVWEMIYEFKVPKGPYNNCGEMQFGLHNFAGEAGPLEGIHSSPSKVEGAAYLYVEVAELRLTE